MSRALALLAVVRSIAGWRTLWRGGRGSPVAWLGKIYILLLILGAAIAWATAVWYSLTSSQHAPLSRYLFSFVREAARVAPLILLFFLLFTVSFSIFEKPFGFSPAEENFLCAGPFRRRQLVHYKIASALLNQILLSFLVAAPSGATLTGRIAVFVGSLLLFNFFQLCSLVAGELGTLLGFQDPRGLRRLGITLGVILPTLAFVWVRFGSSVDDVPGFARQLERSGAWSAATSPLRWFVEVALARQLWPDLVKWSALCLVVNGLIFMLVHVLDARLQERSEQDEARAGAGESEDLEIGRPASKRLRWALPLFARCRGLGPIAWRQGMDVFRRPDRIAFALFMYSLLLFLLFAVPRGARELIFLPTIDGHAEINAVGARVCGAAAIFLVMFTALGLSFDFRADIGHIDVLKGLPISPIVLTAGQLFVPVTIAALMQWLALVVLAIGLGSLPSGILIAAGFVPPASLVLMAIENLAAFWFPMRQTPGMRPEPFEQLGHVLVQPLIRMACYGAAIGATVLVATSAYFLFGQSGAAALAAAWLTLAAGGAGLVLLVSEAFDDFDVARGSPA